MEDEHDGAQPAFPPGRDPSLAEAGLHSVTQQVPGGGLRRVRRQRRRGPDDGAGSGGVAAFRARHLRDRQPFVPGQRAAGRKAGPGAGGQQVLRPRARNAARHTVRERKADDEPDGLRGGHRRNGLGTFDGGILLADDRLHPPDVLLPAPGRRVLARPQRGQQARQVGAGSALVTGHDGDRLRRGSVADGCGAVQQGAGQPGVGGNPGQGLTQIRGEAVRSDGTQFAEHLDGLIHRRRRAGRREAPGRGRRAIPSRPRTSAAPVRSATAISGVWWAGAAPKVLWS